MRQRAASRRLGEEVAWLGNLDCETPEAAGGCCGCAHHVGIFRRLAERGPRRALRKVGTNRHACGPCRHWLRSSCCRPPLTDDFDAAGARTIGVRYEVRGNRVAMELFVSADVVDMTGEPSLGWERVHRERSLCIPSLARISRCSPIRTSRRSPTSSLRAFAARSAPGRRRRLSVRSTRAGDERGSPLARVTRGAAARRGPQERTLSADERSAPGVFTRPGDGRHFQAARGWLRHLLVGYAGRGARFDRFRYGRAAASRS